MKDYVKYFLLWGSIRDSYFSSVSGRILCATINIVIYLIFGAALFFCFNTFFLTGARTISATPTPEVFQRGTDPNVLIDQNGRHYFCADCQEKVLPSSTPKGQRLCQSTASTAVLDCLGKNYVSIESMDRGLVGWNGHYYGRADRETQTPFPTSTPKPTVILASTFTPAARATIPDGIYEDVIISWPEEKSNPSVLIKLADGRQGYFSSFCQNLDPQKKGQKIDKLWSFSQKYRDLEVKEGKKLGFVVIITFGQIDAIEYVTLAQNRYTYDIWTCLEEAK